MAIGHQFLKLRKIIRTYGKYVTGKLFQAVKNNTAMYNITMISTRHDEIGECNSYALWQILEDLRPQVIFLELPPSYLSKAYISSTNKLETNALRPYIDAHNPITVAVDIDDIPDKTFFDGYIRVFEELKKLEGANGVDFHNSVNTNTRYAAMYGFKYLNSEHGIACNEAISKAMTKGLEQINDDSLTNAHNAWTAFINRRENEMLQNIYTYSENYSYERAVFFLGAAHRKAVCLR